MTITRSPASIVRLIFSRMGLFPYLRLKFSIKIVADIHILLEQ
jgi:hypothetical protein